MSAPQRTVLIVDDHEENRYTTRHALMRAGFQIMEAVTGQQGLELSKQMPDVIVLDVRLPDILGYEVCRSVRANPITCHIPVLQLSAAFLSTESKLYALESGANAYLAQPVDPLVLVGTVRSLLRLQDAEQEARAALRQWTATFDALGEGVAIVRNGVVQHCNRAMTELLGKAYSEIEQQSYTGLLRQEFGSSPDELHQNSAVDVQVENRYFRLSTVSLPANDMAAGDVFIVADVTPRKQAEQALLMNERLAATGRMAHTIAHEINNPLEAITNLVYLAQTHPDVDGVPRQYLLTAADEVRRISEITRQILSFHREAVSPVDTPIAQLVEDVLALSARSAADKNIQIDLKANRSLTVCGYPARLRQAVSNIIRNAIEASPEASKVTVRISRSTTFRFVKPEPAVRITVSDGGNGIPKEHLNKVFEAFFTTKSQKGSGIGLWLTQTIIQEHQGRLQLRSSIRAGASGTCFSVLLPLYALRDAESR